MFRSIIVPVDIAQKEKAAAMIAAARQLLDKDGTLTLCNVVDVVSSYELIEVAGPLRTQLTEDARAQLTTLAEAEGLKADIEVHVGHPANTILDLARQRQADCIVIASHRPGLQDYFLGSTAARVVRHATCSVLVLR